MGLEGLLLLEDLLDELLLLNEESAENAILDARVAAGATVSAVDLAAALGHLGHLGGADALDTVQGLAAVTALDGTGVLAEVVHVQLATLLDQLDLVGLGGVADLF